MLNKGRCYKLSKMKHQIFASPTKPTSKSKYIKGKWFHPPYISLGKSNKRGVAVIIVKHIPFQLKKNKKGEKVDIYLFRELSVIKD